MPADLDATIAAAGYAKVIVALQPQAAAAPPAELRRHFILPSERQSESLALFARHAASVSTPREPPPIMRIYPHLGLALGFVDRGGADALATSAAVTRMVEAPELSLIRPVTTRRARLAMRHAWGVRRLGADRLWAQGVRGRGVIVGHLDTGVDGTHPALGGAVAAFAEFDMRGVEVQGAKAHDGDGHGTHTAGTIVARGSPKGQFGVAPEAELASAMVIEGGQVIDRILAGMDWIIERRARIMSMSLGLRGFTPAFQAVIDAVRAAGVLPVIAVGNEGPLSSRSPGNYANVLSVGACAEDDTVADFSGSQKFDRADDPLVPDIVAPGVDVLSCVPGGGYAKMDGSSMATPHVAGLAALLVSAKPEAGVEELEAAILGSCARPSSMPQARANHGVPDGPRALRIMLGEERAAA